jgi:hypothetical protein
MGIANWLVVRSFRVGVFGGLQTGGLQFSVLPRRMVTIRFRNYISNWEVFVRLFRRLKDAEF